MTPQAAAVHTRWSSSSSLEEEPQAIRHAGLREAMHAGLTGHPTKTTHTSESNFNQIAEGNDDVKKELGTTSTATTSGNTFNHNADGDDDVMKELSSVSTTTTTTTTVGKIFNEIAGGDDDVKKKLGTLFEQDFQEMVRF